MTSVKKIYFVSDAHLGALWIRDSHEQEQTLVRWLESIRADASEIFLMGDMFDFWFEYKTVVPKGYVRFLGKLAELAEAGIAIHFFAGNHDIWTFGYLEQETGLMVHPVPEIIERNGKRFFLAHGDGLGRHPLSVRIIRWIFHNRTCQTLFSWLPPRLGMRFGFAWSKANRKNHRRRKYADYLGEDNETLVQFAKSFPENEKIDYFIFGHRHILLDLVLKNGSRVCILGDWFETFSYGVFDGSDFVLELFDK